MTSLTRLQKLREVFKNATELAQDEQLAVEEVPAKLKDIWNELDRKNDEGSVSASEMPSMVEFTTELKVLETTGSLLGRVVREFQITGGQAFSSEDYAEKLLAKLTTNHEEIDWTLMTPDVVRIINRAPGIHIFLGCFDVSESSMIHKKSTNKKQVKVERMELEEKKAPCKVESMEVDDNSVGQKVEYLKRNLHRCYKENLNEPISFYKFILHPGNFTTTVENIFHISFIIKDGSAHLDIVDDDIVIRPANESKLVDNGNGQAAKKSQMVFSISMEEWKDLVKTYNIETALIK